MPGLRPAMLMLALGAALAPLGAAARAGAASGTAASSQAIPQPQKATPLKPTPRNMRGLPGKLKIDLASGIPLVEARIGEESLKLVIDTGASWSLIRPEAAKRLGLPLRESEELKARDAAGEERGVDAAHIEKLLLEVIPDGNSAAGPIELGDFDLVVLESPVVQAAGADGILGLPVFRRMVARFDFAAQTLELGGESLAAADDGRTLSIRSSEGGLVTIEGRFVPVEAEADEVAAVYDPRDLLLDTGFSGFLHLPAAAAKELAPDGQGQSAGVASTALREREFERVTLARDLLLGRYRIQRPIASVFKDAKVSDGAVGTGLLRHFVVTLDVPKRRIRLEAPADVVQLGENRRLQPAEEHVPSSR